LVLEKMLVRMINVKIVLFTHFLLTSQLVGTFPNCRRRINC